MPQFKYLLGGVLVILISHFDAGARTTTSPDLWYSKLNSTQVVDDLSFVMCRWLRRAMERNTTAVTPCLQALVSSPAEHLILLSYSSGHVLETLAILTGAGVINNAEDVAFLSSLHLNDRGSPAACNDIDGAHYCIARPASPVSFGLCVPRSCDSASLMAVLGYPSNMSRDAGHVVGVNPDNGPQGGFPSVVCGDESRLSVNTGTICALVAIGGLITLIATATAIDYCLQRHREVLLRKQSGMGDGRSAPIGENHQIVPRSKSSLAPDSTEVGHDHAAREDQRGAGAQTLTIGGREYFSFGHEDERKECEGRDDSTLRIEGRIGETEPNGFSDSRGLRSVPGCEDSMIGEPLLPFRDSLQLGSRSRSCPFTQLFVRARFEDIWWWRCLKCFSLRINVDKLFSPPPSPNKFSALDGVRCFSIMWVVLGHVMIYSAEGAGLTNFIDLLPVDGHGLLARFTAQVIPGAFFAVDSFFLMSGFLLSVTLLPKLKSSSVTSGRGIFKIYLHRYLRLTPMVLFITVIRWQLFPLASRGPTWWPAAASHKEECNKHWWGELLYISNLVPWPPLSNLCNPITWYLGNDMQFFIVGVPVIATYSHRPCTMVVFLALLMLTSWSYTLWLADREKLSFSIVISGASSAWREIYTTPWCRCSVYIMGVLAGIGWTTLVEERGVLLHDRINESRASSGHRASRRRVYVAAAVFASALLMALPVYGSYGGYQDVGDARVAVWLDHLYLVFSRPTWALGVMLMCGLCFFGYGGFVNAILTLPAWTTFSRLTFGVFLTHTLLLDWLYLSGDAARDFTYAGVSITFMGTLFGSSVLAFIMYLMVEAPFRNLESLARMSLGGEGSR